MANPLANTVIEIKFHGQKIKVRVLEDGDRITSRCIQRSFMIGYPNSMNKEQEVDIRNRQLSEPDVLKRMKNADWYPCTCVGEKTDEHNHHHRVYLEILSPFVKAVSDDSGTEPKDKGKADL
jgi:uncharacterized Zn-finger protein